MFIRAKVVKGFTYHQVVRSERDGARVRQMIVAHLGRWPTVGEALKAEKKKLARWRRARSAWPETFDPAGYSKGLVAQLARADAGIRESAGRIELLADLQATMEGKPKGRTRSAN